MGSLLADLKAVHSRWLKTPVLIRAANQFATGQRLSPETLDRDGKVIAGRTAASTNHQFNRSGSPLASRRKPVVLEGNHSTGPTIGQC